MTCEHIPKVVTWGVDREQNCKSVVLLYGCTNCDKTWKKLPKEKVAKAVHTHTEFVDGCFACKIKTLELGTGDAGRADAMPQKKWDKELADYRDARRQGIQPEGTSSKQIEAAKQASEIMGSAFNAETMGSAKAMTKSKAEGMKVLDIK